MLCFKTPNTTRLCAPDLISMAVQISRFIYASKRPDSIILARADIWQDVLAATPLIHFPRNAPILLTAPGFLPPVTAEEIRRLNPRGVNGVHIFVIGAVGWQVPETLQDMGYAVKHITGRSYYETAAEIVKFLGYPEKIMLLSGETAGEGLAAGAWAAHMGDPIVYTTKDRLPAVTAEVIKRAGKPEIYVVGSPWVISEAVVEEIRKLDVKIVERISGQDAFEIAANFARYQSPVSKFGWGRSDKGAYAYTFVPVHQPVLAGIGALNAHLGKHTPVLVVRENMLPEAIRRYLEEVKPIPKDESKVQTMHGIIPANYQDLSVPAQIEIEEALKIPLPMHGE